MNKYYEIQCGFAIFETMKEKSGRGAFRKVLFLEIAGFLSLLVSVAVIALVVAMHAMDLKVLMIPAAGLLLTVTFVLLTVSYMRKDLHRIHELHSKPVYAFGRYLVYVMSVGLIAWGVYTYASTDDFWSDIGAVVMSVVSIIIAVFALYYTITLGYLIQHEHLRHSSVGLADIGIVVLFPVLLVAGSVYMMFSEKAVTVETGKADFILPAASIIAEFEKNADSAAAKFVGKSVKFGGRVQEIQGDSVRLLKLSSGVAEYTVNCGFDMSVYEKVKAIQTGDSVELQCSCSGVTRPDGEMDLLSEKSLDMTRCNPLRVVK